MTDEVLLSPLGHDVLLTHFLLYGAAAIAEAAGHRDVRMMWTTSLRPAPLLRGVSLEELAAAVSRHATAALDDQHWIQTDLPGTPGRGLFSPRIGRVGDRAAWENLQRHRHTGLDDVAAQARFLDLRLIAALGEPSYWRVNRKGELLQDDGASRFEMQPRNQGSEFVGTRLRALAATVAARSEADVSQGLAGLRTRDEAGKDKPDSRSAAGLRSPAVTDNAVAWVAMWGIAQSVVALRAHERGRTAAHVPMTDRESQWRDGHFAVPLWTGGWTTARLRNVLSSRNLLEGAQAATRQSTEEDHVGGAHDQWLREHTVSHLVVFPVGRFGSASAPERRASTGLTAGLEA